MILETCPPMIAEGRFSSCLDGFPQQTPVSLVGNRYAADAVKVQL